MSPIEALRHEVADHDRRLTEIETKLAEMLRPGQERPYVRENDASAAQYEYAATQVGHRPCG